MLCRLLYKLAGVYNKSEVFVIKNERMQAKMFNLKSSILIISDDHVETNDQKTNETNISFIISENVYFIARYDEKKESYYTFSGSHS